MTAQPVPDAPGPAHSFSVGDEEFVAGTGAGVAEQAIAQCRAVGAGHFLAIFSPFAPREKLGLAHELFAKEAIPALREAAV